MLKLVNILNFILEISNCLVYSKPNKNYLSSKANKLVDDISGYDLEQWRRSQLINFRKELGV